MRSVVHSTVPERILPDERVPPVIGSLSMVGGHVLPGCAGTSSWEGPGLVQGYPRHEVLLGGGCWSGTQFDWFRLDASRRWIWISRRGETGLPCDYLPLGFLETGCGLSPSWWFGVDVALAFSHASGLQDFRLQTRGLFRLLPLVLRLPWRLDCDFGLPILTQSMVWNLVECWDLM